MVNLSEIGDNQYPCPYHPTALCPHATQWGGCTTSGYCATRESSYRPSTDVPDSWKYEPSTTDTDGLPQTAPWRKPDSMPDSPWLESEAPNQSAKADAGKPKISLVPPQIIRDIAEVREYGNRKYHDPDNWKEVEVDRYIDALLRHTLAFMEDPGSKDEESGIPHYKHMACNLAFICELFK